MLKNLLKKFFYRFIARAFCTCQDIVDKILKAVYFQASKTVAKDPESEQYNNRKP